ncbi:MAG: hypothetical protein PVG55_03300 [Nitrospirota bacterium]|jgi:opacity protein-like surface antigen
MTRKIFAAVLAAVLMTALSAAAASADRKGNVSGIDDLVKRQERNINEAYESNRIDRRTANSLMEELKGMWEEARKLKARQGGLTLRQRRDFTERLRLQHPRVEWERPARR